MECKSRPDITKGEREVGGIKVLKIPVNKVLRLITSRPKIKADIT